MLRIVQSSSAAGAARYYLEGLKREDYLAMGGEVAGLWHGKALQKLGITAGAAETPEQFTALLNNRHPDTGKQLTPRMNAAENRIPGWDFVFSVPKSVSLVQAITGDADIVRAFHQSVVEAMAEVEKLATTRVRRGGKQQDRLTGNLAYTTFLHRTTRPVDGSPDPHLHIHAYVQNLTFDETENRFKAAKIRAIKDRAYYFEALADSILATKLTELGYGIETTAKGWEIAGLSDPELIKRFSRRTEEIERLAIELGISDPAKKAKLGATTRNHKQNDVSLEALREQWKARLTSAELALIERTHLRNSSEARPAKPNAAEAIEFAAAKLFERESVVDKERLLATALRFGMGSVRLADLAGEMTRRSFIEKDFNGSVKITTKELVREEVAMVRQVREGRGKMAPLVKQDIKFIHDFLSDEQKQAVRHILQSHDRVMALRGYAGTGKTTLLTEVRQQLERIGVRMVALAPSADASRGVLRADGFAGADTVARFLVDRKLQDAARGQFLLIDEAGTIGNRDYARLLELVGPTTRILLSGDTGQHAPVSRGDTMRQLENFAGLEVATVRQIQRQEAEGYRKAVEVLASGDVKAGIRKLEEIGAVIQIQDNAERYRRLAEDYHQCLIQSGVPPLLVAPTHAEARTAIAAVRERLHQAGLLGASRSFLQYRDLKLEEAEKTRPENYREGLMVQLHQNLKGLKRGSILPVLGVDEQKNVWVRNPLGLSMKLDLSKAAHFRVYEIGKVDLANGDRIKITNGGKDLHGKRLDNGKLATVLSIGKDGSLLLDNGLKLGANFGHINHAYDTSHSSQGKTAREVLVAQSSMAGKAASQEQFYVSVSRGKDRVRIYTDASDKLRDAVGKSSRRLSALEVTGIGKYLFMEGGLTGQKWAERIAQGRAWRMEKLQGQIDKASQVSMVASQRKLSPSQAKSETFQQYLDMRRHMRGPDGKSRSKGYGGNPGKGHKPQKTLDFRRGGITPTPFKEKAPSEAQSRKKSSLLGKDQKSTSTKKAFLAAAKIGALPQSLLNHTEKALKSSSRHLAEAVGRTKDGMEALKSGAKRAIQFGNLKTTLGKLQGHAKAWDANVRKQAAQKPPAPKPPSPAPVIRRGR